MHTQIWPETTLVHNNHLMIGGCDLVDLAATYGTPLYIFDEATLRSAMRNYRTTLARHYPGEVRVHYASKALINTAIAQIVAQEGLGLDVVSGTELLLAKKAGVPLERVHVHGNAKSLAELQRAVAWKVGAIVVDTADELEQLIGLSKYLETPQGVLLRIAPNIDAHTHAHIATGSAQSKFGLPLEQLDSIVTQIMAAPGLRLLGLHAHIGSQLFEPAQITQAIDVLMQQAAHIRERFGVFLEEISPGGGLGIPYTTDMPPSDLNAYARAIGWALQQAAARHNLPLPRLTVEPGRSIAGRAGVALYQVVGRKYAADGTPTYLHIDGGMADNIRPALYAARYTALLANQVAAPATHPIDVAGRYCESGDVLLRGVSLPLAQPGDLLAVAVAGAYTLSMASNYNMVPRPAVILVQNGSARLIQRRETEEDLIARDLML